MSEQVPTIKVFVNLDNAINFTCPSCDKPQSISADNIKKKISPLKVRCTCKQIINLDIDYRRFYRKKSSLAGIYRSIRPNRPREEDILIVNISREGIGFRVFTGQKIKAGDELEIQFNLDDKKKSSLRKQVDVISVDADFIGCRFRDDQPFDMALGYYLQR